ncbi:TrmB family transcriptional regulator [Sporomusa aerivorans]|uniref:TrmB family transcriptional regulator n=1 Tax=Sporomusa aerivorans TaxID=204936 RepID=UPI00352B3567
MNDIILKLEQLGFSAYEAKAYYTLLKKHPANGYEISKIGRIPAAKIYDTFSRLKIKGFIIESSTETGKYYPVPPDKLISRVKTDFAGIIDGLELQLRETEPIVDIDLTMNLASYETILDKMVTVIQSSQTSLLLSLWPDEAVLLADTVATAKKRGVVVIAAVFGTCSLDCNYCISLEPCGLSSFKRLGKRLTAIVSDNKEVVIGEIDTESTTEGIWTTTPGIVLVTKEYIKHDIWGSVLIDALGKDNFQKLCEQNQLLAYLIKNR